MLGPVALTGRTPRRRGCREGQGEEWARRHLSDRQPNGKKAREQTKRSCRSKKPLDLKSPIQGRNGRGTRPIPPYRTTSFWPRELAEYAAFRAHSALRREAHLRRSEAGKLRLHPVARLGIVE